MAPKRILVAQMTRMGDVLQTSPLIRAIKTREPDAYICVMIRRMGKAIAACNPDVNDIIEYEEDEMYLDLRSNDADRLLKAYERAAGYVQELRKGRFDIVYNCTHSLCSAMLFKLAGIPEVVGAHLSDDWRYVWRGRGPNYFITSVLHREANDLNLCDSFRHFMDDPPAATGLVLTCDDTAREDANALLNQHGISQRDFVACFQLGASDRDKRWPEERFAELGRLLAERRNARIVLVGVASEAPLGEVFERHAPGLAVHLFGKTSIPQLAALLARSDVLVTNDTGTMHIAASVKCPIVLVSVGYVHFRETGPYGAGHCAIELRRGDVGRSDIRGRDQFTDQGILPEQVYRAVDLVHWHKAKTPPTVQESELLANVDLHWSEFAPDGCLQWYPVIRRAMTDADMVRTAYRPMWLEYFAQTKRDVEHESMTRLLAHYLPPTDFTYLDAASEALLGLADLAAQGQRMTKDLVAMLQGKSSMKRAQECVGAMMALDEDIRVYAELNRACKPLVAITRFERDNLEGSDPLRLAKRTQEIYRDLEWRARGTMQKLSTLKSLVGAL